MLRIRAFESQDEDQVVAIWRACGLVVPWNDPTKDIRRKLCVGPELFLVAEQGKELVGVLMGGYDGHRASINYFGVHPSRQRQGIGTALLCKLEKRLAVCDAPRIKLMVRRADGTSMQFFEAVGFV